MPSLAAFAVRTCASLLALSLAARAGADLRLSDQGWEERAPIQTNGLIEPGESGRLVLSLWNDSAAEASGISGTLSVVAPAAGVAVSSPVASWADLPPGASAQDGGTFVIDVSPALACGDAMQLALDLVSSSGSVRVPIHLRTGASRPVALPGVTLPFGGNRPHAAIRDDVVGVAARSDDGVTSWIDFGRFDAVTGAGLGSVVTLSGADHHRYPRVAAGPDRWCVTWVNATFINANDAWYAVLAGDGTVLATQRLHAAQADRRGASPPTVASDGTGFGMVFRADRLGEEAQSAREIVYVHVGRDGVVDAGPVRIDLGLAGAVGSHSVTWTGSEFAVVVQVASDSRLVRVRPDGSATVGPPLPRTGIDPALTTTGHGLGVAAAESFAWHGLLALAPDGTARAAPGALAAPPSPAYRHDDWPVSGITWDGAGFGFAVTAGVLTGDDSSHFVTFGWLDADGRRHHPDVQLSPIAPDQHVAVVGDAAYDAARGEYRIPVVDGSGWEGMGFNWLRTGNVRLLRVGRGSSCPAGEAPREVSATAPTALRVRKEFGPLHAGDPGRLVVVASFEDLGAEAHAYNLTVAKLTTDSPGFETFAPGCWESPQCGVTPLAAPFTLRPDGARRLAWWALPSLSTTPPPLRRLDLLFVTASNASGEGPRAHDALGRPIPARPGCFAVP